MYYTILYHLLYIIHFTLPTIYIYIHYVIIIIIVMLSIYIYIIVVVILQYSTYYIHIYIHILHYYYHYYVTITLTTIYIYIHILHYYYITNTFTKRLKKNHNNNTKKGIGGRRERARSGRSLVGVELLERPCGLRSGRSGERRSGQWSSWGVLGALWGTLLLCGKSLVPSCPSSAKTRERRNQSKAELANEKERD